MPSLLHQARILAAAGETGAARAAYLKSLQNAPSLEALVELGAIAAADGFRAAARSCFAQALAIDPKHPVALCGMGQAAIDAEDWRAAKAHYAAALAASPGFPPAHQGLAHCLAARGEAGAAAHARAGFAGRAIVPPRRMAPGSAHVLLIVAAAGGNIPCRHWLDPENFAVTTLYADMLEATAKLPPHDLVLNAIGDADLCQDALARAAHLLAGSTVPVINPPGRVARTSRADNARRLAGLPGVIVPRMTELHRASLAKWHDFPVLLRSPGFHAGQHFRFAATAKAMAAALALLPGDKLLAIDYHDCRGADGLARKYRVLFIGGRILPLHLAVSHEWKVHYFSAAMATDPALRQEEARFLADMPGTVGPAAMGALAAIGAELGLDYAGADFALAPDGRLILFEANATMLIHQPDASPIWDYRRPAISQALASARALLDPAPPD